MRRSRSVVLTLLAVTALAACDNAEDVDIAVPSVDACVERFGAATADQCQMAFSNANRDHLKIAPQFPSLDACREETGSECQIMAAPPNATAAGSDPFSGVDTVANVAIPVMAGVLIGKVMSNGSRPTMPLYAGRPPNSCPPEAPPGTCAPAQQQRSGGGGGGFVSYYSGRSYAGQSQGALGQRGTMAFAPSSSTSTAFASTARATTAARAASVSRGGMGHSAGGHGGGVGA